MFLVGIVLTIAGCGDEANTDDGEDFAPPRVVETTPKNGGVWTPGTSILVVFNEEVTSESVSKGVLVIGAEGVVVYDSGSKTASWTPKENLRSGAAYTLTIREIEDLAGNRMTEVVSVNFTVK